jgi:transcriptional regulator of acetoin/glycerol metabolism
MPVISSIDPVDQLYESGRQRHSVENRVEVERRREKEMAEFASLHAGERRTIIDALTLCRGCRAAALLGVSEATLYRRLKEYGQ